MIGCRVHFASDDYSIFKRVYEIPILKSRAPDATSKDIELGQARTAQVIDPYNLNHLAPDVGFSSCLLSQEASYFDEMPRF